MALRDALPFYVLETVWHVLSRYISLNPLLVLKLIRHQSTGTLRMWILPLLSLGPLGVASPTQLWSVLNGCNRLDYKREDGRKGGGMNPVTEF
jgi:mannitol-specific phosphotransferase system IIBC component